MEKKHQKYEIFARGFSETEKLGFPKSQISARQLQTPDRGAFSSREKPVGIGILRRSSYINLNTKKKIYQIISTHTADLTLYIDICSLLTQFLTFNGFSPVQSPIIACAPTITIISRLHVT